MTNDEKMQMTNDESPGEFRTLSFISHFSLVIRHSL